MTGSEQETNRKSLTFHSSVTSSLFCSNFRFIFGRFRFILGHFRFIFGHFRFIFGHFRFISSLFPVAYGSFPNITGNEQSIAVDDRKWDMINLNKFNGYCKWTESDLK